MLSERLRKLVDEAIPLTWGKRLVWQVFGVDSYRVEIPPGVLRVYFCPALVANPPPGAGEQYGVEVLKKGGVSVFQGRVSPGDADYYSVYSLFTAAAKAASDGEFLLDQMMAALDKRGINF